MVGVESAARSTDEQIAPTAPTEQRAPPRARERERERVADLKRFCDDFAKLRETHVREQRRYDKKAGLYVE